MKKLGGCAAVVLFLMAPSAMAAPTCPLDKATFKSEKTGREFIVTRVATDYCAENEEYASDCEGPYGKTIIEGKLDGKKITLVHQVFDGVPCCYWHSHAGAATAFKEVKQPLRWLSPGKAEVIEIGSGTIGQKSTPMEQDTGPLGDDVLTATACRE